MNNAKLRVHITRILQATVDLAYDCGLQSDIPFGENLGLDQGRHVPREASHGVVDLVDETLERGAGQADLLRADDLQLQPLEAPGADLYHFELPGQGQHLEAGAVGDEPGERGAGDPGDEAELQHPEPAQPDAARELEGLLEGDVQPQALERGVAEDVAEQRRVHAPPAPELDVDVGGAVAEGVADPGVEAVGGVGAAGVGAEAEGGGGGEGAAALERAGGEEGVAVGVEEEVEARDGLPEVEPALGEEAGADGVLGGEEGEDVVEEVVVEGAKPVATTAVGPLTLLPLLPLLLHDCY